MKLFMTGTDTGVGKTYVSKHLLEKYNLAGHQTIGVKPLATGCQRINNQLMNDDALILQQTASIKLDYDLVNPFAFEPPIAPHLAATKANKILSVKQLVLKTQQVFEINADMHLVEGVGGWHVPLNDSETMADYVRALNISVVLVVSIKLGCLNHAILTAKAIMASGCELVGWVANCMHETDEVTYENIETLKTWLDAPLLSVI